MDGRGADFTVDGGGPYRVPFVAGGVTLAGLPPADSETFQPLIDDPWSGSGFVSFFMDATGRGTFEILARRHSFHGSNQIRQVLLRNWTGRRIFDQRRPQFLSRISGCGRGLGKGIADELNIVLVLFSQ